MALVGGTENEYPLAWRKLEYLIGAWLRTPHLMRIAVGDLIYNVRPNCFAMCVTQVFAIARTITYCEANSLAQNLVLLWSFPDTASRDAILPFFGELGFALTPAIQYTPDLKIVSIGLSCSALLSLAARMPDIYAHTFAAEFDPVETQRIYDVLAAVPRHVIDAARFRFPHRQQYGFSTTKDLEQRSYAYTLYAWARLLVWAPMNTCLRWSFFNNDDQKQLCAYFPADCWLVRGFNTKHVSVCYRLQPHHPSSYSIATAFNTAEDVFRTTLSHQQ